MGQVIIDVPQNVNIKTTIESVEVADEILEIIGKNPDSPSDLQKKTKAEKTPAILPPRRNSLKEDGEAVLGIWSDNEEVADKIAREIREKNRKVT
jgi:hypothetical protein